MLIKSTTLAGDIVVDSTAATKASIEACRAANRRLLALSNDEAVFCNVLKPLMSLSAPSTTKNPCLEPVISINDKDKVKDITTVILSVDNNSFCTANEMGQQSSLSSQSSIITSSSSSDFLLPSYAEA